VVAVAIDGTGNEYAATVITGVQPGNSLGTVPLTSPPVAPATITVPITTSTGSTGTVADLSVSALQSIGSVLATIPLAQQSAATATVTTASGPACVVANTDCASQPLGVPASNPSIGTFTSGGTQTASTPSWSANYTVDANAFVPLTAGQPDCSPSNMQTSQDASNNPLTVTPGGNVTTATLAFTGCL